jgi:HPt (histidine-containing phosphotransfer) domain-containing protein
MISLRLDEELKAAIDEAAAVAGVPRSQWIKTAIQRELGRRRLAEPVPKISKEGSVRVSLRLNTNLLKHIDRAALQLEMTRGQWLRKRAVGAWVDPPPIGPVMDQLLKLHAQIYRMGHNINAAAHAVHSAAANGNSKNLAEAADTLNATARETWVPLKEATNAIIETGARGSEYWRHN